MQLTMKLRLPSHFEVRATEWLLSIIQFGWGVILLTGGDIFANPFFTAMREMAPQTTWGTIALVTGGLHLLALYWNGTKQRSPHLRAICSMIGTLFWFQVSLGFLALGEIIPGWVVHPVFFGFSVYNVVRAMGDARASDDKARTGVVQRGRRSKQPA